MNQMTTNPWPALPLAEWKDTYSTLHMWTQIVGKIRLKLTPLLNHWWNVTLYVTPRGLTTSTMSYKGRHFQIDFDFISHLLIIQTSDGSIKTIALRPRSVADFYQETMATMKSLGMPVTIWTTPSEVPDRTPFENDEKHAAYDPKYVHQFWRTQPPEAFYHIEMGEFLLPYEVVRTAESPDEVLLSFLQSTYEAAATCAKWDRRALERQ
jgi:hypothetical protein